jgi:glutamate-5-semialdehyde dehydrogenase
LKGGSEAINSNRILIQILRRVLVDNDLPEDVVHLIDSTDREAAVVLMRMNQYLDVLIPRGGAGLIKTIVANSSIPVIET